MNQTDEKPSHGKGFDGFYFSVPEYSEWVCDLFGAKENEGITWNPLKGEEPNWFWRKMQYVVFGNRWRRKLTEDRQK